MPQFVVVVFFFSKLLLFFTFPCVFWVGEFKSQYTDMYYRPPFFCGTWTTHKQQAIVSCFIYKTLYVLKFYIKSFIWKRPNRKCSNFFTLTLHRSCHGAQVCVKWTTHPAAPASEGLHALPLAFSHALSGGCVHAPSARPGPGPAACWCCFWPRARSRYHQVTRAP